MQIFSAEELFFKGFFSGLKNTFFTEHLRTTASVSGSVKPSAFI